MPTCGILRDFEVKSPATARIFHKKVGFYPLLWLIHAPERFKNQYQR